MLINFKDLIHTDSKDLNVNDYNLAIYYHISGEDLKTALDYSEKAKKLFPNSELFYGYSAWILLQNEDLTEQDLQIIKDDIDKALAINTENPMIVMVNGIYNVKIKNNTEALVIFKKAQNLDKS
jgi:tetratricopeptide (TPR) repeat protein